MSSIDIELANPETTFEGRLNTFIASQRVPALSEQQINAVKRRIDFFGSAIGLLGARLGSGANTEQAFNQLDTYIKYDYFTASDKSDMTAQQLVSVNQFIKSVIKKQAENLKEQYSPVIVSPQMERWMANGMIPTDNIVTPNARSPVEFAQDTIPLQFLENNPYSVEALNNQLRVTRQKIENDSPIVLHLFIEDDLNLTLANLAAKIESLTTPNMTAEALSLKAGHLIDHIQSLEKLKKVAQAKIAKALNLGEGEEAAYPIIEYIVIGDDGSSEEPLPNPEVKDLSNAPVLTDAVTDPNEMNKIIKQSVKIQKAVETLTGDELTSLRTNVLLPMYKETLAELAAKSANKTTTPHLSKIEPEDLFRHADFLKGQIKIADKRIEAEAVLKTQTQNVSVITDAVILTKSQIIQQQEIPAQTKSRFSGWIRDTWNRASNTVKVAIAGSLGFGVSLATAFAINANNAPEAPEVPKLSPIAVTSVTSNPITIAPAAPVAETVVINSVETLAAAEPVRTKPVNLAKRNFASAVEVRDDKPIIEKSFDIATMRSDLSSLVEGCKKAGAVKVGGVCDSIKSYEITNSP